MKREFEFELHGTSDLLMSANDINAADELKQWQKDPKNKKISVSGDDRSPAWTWLSRTYFDEKGQLAIPQECVMASLRSGASEIIMKKQTTYKRVSQYGIMMSSEFCDFRFETNKTFKKSDFDEVMGRPFSEHLELAEKIGFKLFAKRAKIGQAQHIRVRPRFSDWTISGLLIVTEDVITKSVLSQMFDIAGRQAGIGDWRPGAPKSPGPFGMYQAVVNEIK